MIRFREVIFLFLFIMFLSLTFSAEDSYAQMSIQYPKRFSFSGLIELSYDDRYWESQHKKREVEYHKSFINQRYRISVKGFIYHPRLIVFNAGVKFTDSRQLAYIGAGKTNSQALGYNLLMTFLPYRPVSLDLYAGNTDYTIKPIGDFINPEWERTHELNHNFYGAKLKIMKAPYPFIRLEYQHEENDLYSTVGKPGTIESDRYTLDIRGHARFWTTLYQLLLEYYDFSSPTVDYQAKFIRLNVRSVLKPGIFLHNSFYYSDVDLSKMLSLTSQLYIDHRKRIFNQYYSYRFIHSETWYKGIKSMGIPKNKIERTVNSLSGAWSYRFFSDFLSSLSLNYGKRDETYEEATFYGISFSLSYGRALLGLNISPRYRFIFRKDELKGQLVEHNLLLDLLTRNLRWGTIYSNYSLTISKEDARYRHALGNPEFGFDGGFETRSTKTDSTIQNLRTGIRGRAPGQLFSRAQWNLEANIFYSDATIERDPPESYYYDDDFFFEPGKQKLKRKIRRYSLLSNISYPVGWVSIFFNSGYSIGKTDDRDMKRFFIEQRIQYPLLRNLDIYFKWKELWERTADYPTRRVEEYSLSAEYRIGRTMLTATSRIIRTNADNIDTYQRLFYLMLRRTL